MPSNHIETANAILKVREFVNELTRGGEYVPLFAHRAMHSNDSEITHWLNAWLLTTEKQEELEASEQDFDVYGYIQQGFHPGLILYGGSSEKFSYEPIYCQPTEPLVLGWSADKKALRPTISQEFERFYQLSSEVDAKGRYWNCWQHAIDHVLIEQEADGIHYIIARKDYIIDYLDIRRRWLMLAYYAEWHRRPLGFRPDTAVYRGSKRRRGRFRESCYLKSDEDGSGYQMVELKGYELTPPPKRSQFSRKLGATPKSIEEEARKIEFMTSNGRVKPSQVYDLRYQSGNFMSLVMFDQEVLRKYQDEPGAEMDVDRMGILKMTAKHIHFSGPDVFALGTEYVSAFLGYFVVSVPMIEWSHWKAHNVPFVGTSKLRGLYKEPTLFGLVRGLERLIDDVNSTVQAITGLDWGSPFAELHPDVKDRLNLVKALPAKPAANELVLRAQALNAHFLERLAKHNLSKILHALGVPKTTELEELGSLKLFTSLVGICYLATTNAEWADNPSQALLSAVKQFLNERDGAELLYCYGKLDALFGIYELRQLSAHLAEADIADDAQEILRQHMSYTPQTGKWRDAIVKTYDSLYQALAFARDLT